MEVCSKTTCLGATAGDCFCRLQFGAARGDADFQHELFPLHSPLLRESWLVSFPPLSNMLKSSGSSCLIGGPNGMLWWFFWTRPSCGPARRDCLGSCLATMTSSHASRDYTPSSLPFGRLAARRQQGGPHVRSSSPAATEAKRSTGNSRRRVG